MTEPILLDNDVALKVACYSLVDELISTATVDNVPPAILGVGRFVIRGRLDRASNISNVPRAKTAFGRLLSTVSLVEPDDQELAMAAALEAEASRRDLELDGGESQLLAILAKRACPLLVTGDKRAIFAISQIALELAAKRICCLEQLMAQLVEATGVDAVRSQVCSEPGVDRAVTSCFSCSADKTDQEGVMAGLTSYINHLDRTAPGVLIAERS